jgi:SAM-dependent methyltransferase
MISKQSLKSRVLSVTAPLVRAQVRNSLPDVAPSLMRFGSYYPHDQNGVAYSRPIARSTSERIDTGLPVPPREFWADYCTSAESYLKSGREDYEAMSRIMAASGAQVADAGRILDLGCAGGRMIRWLADLTPQAQVWGCDIWSSAILWCQDNLTPPFWFATTTAAPHLPFEDRSFGLVYCGSLFTHIDELAEAWFLELHRILRPGGRLYFSVNDRHSVSIFDGQGDPDTSARYYERTGGKEVWDAFIASNSGEPDYQRFRSGEAYMTALGRRGMSHVMWDTEVLCQRLAYGFKCSSVNPESYGHQTTVLLERV